MLVYSLCLTSFAHVYGFDLPGIVKKEKEETAPAAKESKTEEAPKATASSSSSDSQLGTLEPILDKALAAYNKGDPKAFWADFSKQMSSITTKETFDALYVQGAKKEFGNFVSKVIKKDECSFNADTPLLIYVGEFEKNKKVKISVNFIKDGNDLKLMQIRFDKI